ncbi:MAG: flagellar hook-length control protein FliK [Maritimibacter sp.]|nr:flagellar hook-length control protein FliK [Maritimibacter sp.]
MPAQTAQNAQTADTARNAAIQIADVVRAGGERAVELRLHPEELGRVQLTMSQDATGGLTVSLNVERPETLDLLRRHIDQLASELRQLGYGSIDFSFRGDGGRDGQGVPSDDGEASTRTEGRARTTGPNDAPQSANPHRLTSSGGIDMRL